MNKLYHYPHCPFCVRVRLAWGYLKIPYESIVLRYDDEETPKKLSGKKMLPIADIGGEVVNESLDILHRSDKDNQLGVAQIVSSNEFKEFEKLLGLLGDQIHSLTMPYWIYTPEFDKESREYFRNKKEVKRGPFENLVQNRKKYQNELKQLISIVSAQLKPFYNSSEFSLYDILLASHLWGMYIVPEFQFPKEVHKYLQKVGSLCDFDYHGDFWRKG